MGHASINVTLDRYGHLLPELDEAIAQTFGRELDEAHVVERATSSTPHSAATAIGDELDGRPSRGTPRRVHAVAPLMPSDESACTPVVGNTAAVPEMNQRSDSSSILPAVNERVDRP